MPDPSTRPDPSPRPSAPGDQPPPALQRAAWRSQLVDALIDPALLFAGSLQLEAANRDARRLFGLGAPIDGLSVVDAVGSASLAAAVEQAVATGARVQVDTERAGQSLRASAALIGDDILLIVTDRTRRQRVEELRRNFVANASHELKTPVTGIRTLSEALHVTLDTGDHERLPQLLGRLDHETERLARLVYDLLDLRRLEEGDPLEAGPVDLAEIVRQVAVAALDDAGERGIELIVDAPDRASIAGVRGDLEVVVKNLVDNALTYSHDGGRIELTLVTRAHDLLLTVTDTGIGIPAEDLGRVFERFYRVDAARSRDSGSTGLGLSIVRHVVERHGGTVRVDSDVGAGSAFTVALPTGSVHPE